MNNLNTNAENDNASNIGSEQEDITMPPPIVSKVSPPQEGGLDTIESTNTSSMEASEIVSHNTNSTKDENGDNDVNGGEVAGTLENVGVQTNLYQYLAQTPQMNY